MTRLGYDRFVVQGGDIGGDVSPEIGRQAPERVIGAITADSPVAQLAWILDKLMAWTHPAEAAAQEILGEEFLFANASLYWFTASAGSAAFVGYAQDEGWGAVAQNSGVPTAAIQFAHDIGIRRLAEPSNIIVRWTNVEGRGGHFAALEEPDLLIADIRAFVGALRSSGGPRTRRVA